MRKMKFTTGQLTIALTVAADISRELDDDYVELWTLPRCIRSAWPNASERTVRFIATSALLALTSRDVVLGDLDGDTGSFSPWRVDNPVEAAMAMWARLGRDPNMGEIAWLSRVARPLGQ